MRPVSDRLKSIVGGSHRTLWRARKVNNWPSGVNPTVQFTPQLLEGKLSFKEGAAGFNFQVNPGFWGSLLPNGPEMFVEFGVDLGGGIIEWTSQGYFRVRTATQDGAPFGPVDVECDDRWAQLADTSSYYPFTVPATTTLANYVSGIILGNQPWTQTINAAFGRFAAITIEWQSAKASDVLGVEIPLLDGTYGEQIEKLFLERQLVGKFDYRGHFIISDLVPPTFANPVAVLRSGPGGNLIRMSRQLDRDGVYNVVMATSSQPAAGSAPAWAYGTAQSPIVDIAVTGFGPVRKDVSFSNETSQAVLIRLADDDAQTQKGIPLATELEIVPNPGLEIGDVVEVRYPRYVSGGLNRGQSGEVTELHLIESIDYSFRSSTCKLKTTTGLYPT